MPPNNPITYLLISLLCVTSYIGYDYEPWQYMWLLVIELYLLFKWTTLTGYLSGQQRIAFPATYLILWVGMNPALFKSRKHTKVKNYKMLINGFVNVLLGVVSIKLAEMVSKDYWVIQGWLVCVAVVMILHFGSFTIMAWVLQTLGFHVRPIMNEPIASKSISDFWGQRWNYSFRELVYPHLYKPLVRKYGLKVAVLLTFVVSGLAHEIVISLPAKTGWGLPTCYFTIQALGMLVEKSHYCKSMGNRAKRAFTYLVVIGPAFFLFHPPFMEKVLLPFSRSIGINV